MSTTATTPAAINAAPATVVPTAVVKNVTKPAKAPSKPAKASKPVATGVRVDLSKVKRGLKKADAVAVVEKFKFPTTPFTLNEIFAATGIYHWYLVDFVKKNAKIVGDAPKAPGVRGKSAKLYQLAK